MLKKIRRDERGIAMVVSLLVAFVVMLLSIYVVQLAVHDVNQSSYDRKRLLSVTAAEAGVNEYYSYLSNLLSKGTASLTSISCSLSEDLSTEPNVATYDAEVTFYNAAGAATACYTGGSNPVQPPPGFIPSAVRIVSVGSAPGEVERKMESYATLAPVYGGTQAALISAGSTFISNKFTINGYEGADADAYVLGDLTVDQNQSYSGNLYVQGKVTLNNSVNVDGTLWALNDISMTQGSSVVTGDAISTNGKITIANPALIYGNAKAKSTILSTAQIRGTSSPNTSGIANPPSQSLPSITFSTSQQEEWSGSGYTITQYTDCTLAKNFITQLAASAGPYKQVVYINSSCTLTFSSNDITLNDNLAIVTKGAICMTTHNSFTAAGGARSLFFIVLEGYGTTTCANSSSIATSQLAEFNDLTGANQLSVFMYSPKKISLSNLSQMNGQVFGSPVIADNQTTLSYVPVYVPGVSKVVGFRQNVQYIRENSV